MKAVLAVLQYPAITLVVGAIALFLLCAVDGLIGLVGGVVGPRERG